MSAKSRGTTDNMVDCDDEDEDEDEDVDGSDARKGGGHHTRGGHENPHRDGEGDDDMKHGSAEGGDGKKSESAEVRLEVSGKYRCSQFARA